jgi:hypothetical protein
MKIIHRGIKLIGILLLNNKTAEVNETKIEVRSDRVPINGLGAGNWGE